MVQTESTTFSTDGNAGGSQAVTVAVIGAVVGVVILLLFIGLYKLYQWKKDALAHNKLSDNNSKNGIIDAPSGSAIDLTNLVSSNNSLKSYREKKDPATNSSTFVPPILPKPGHLQQSQQKKTSPSPSQITQTATMTNTTTFNNTTTIVRADPGIINQCSFSLIFSSIYSGLFGI